MAILQSITYTYTCRDGLLIELGLYVISMHMYAKSKLSQDVSMSCSVKLLSFATGSPANQLESTHKIGSI